PAQSGFGCGLTCPFLLCHKSSRNLAAWRCGPRRRPPISSRSELGRGEIDCSASGSVQSRRDAERGQDDLLREAPLLQAEVLTATAGGRGPFQECQVRRRLRSRGRRGSPTGPARSRPYEAPCVREGRTERGENLEPFDVEFPRYASGVSPPAKVSRTFFPDHASFPALIQGPSWLAANAPS